MSTFEEWQKDIAKSMQASTATTGSTAAQAEATLKAGLASVGYRLLTEEETAEFIAQPACDARTAKELNTEALRAHGKARVAALQAAAEAEASSVYGGDRMKALQAAGLVHCDEAAAAEANFNGARRPALASPHQWQVDGCCVGCGVYQHDIELGTPFANRCTLDPVLSKWVATEMRRRHIADLGRRQGYAEERKKWEAERSGMLSAIGTLTTSVLRLSEGIRTLADAAAIEAKPPGAFIPPAGAPLMEVTPAAPPGFLTADSAWVSLGPDGVYRTSDGRPYPHQLPPETVAALGLGSDLADGKADAPRGSATYEWTSLGADGIYRDKHGNPIKLSNG